MKSPESGPENSNISVETTQEPLPPFLDRSERDVETLLAERDQESEILPVDLSQLPQLEELNPPFSPEQKEADKIKAEEVRAELETLLEPTTPDGGSEVPPETTEEQPTMTEEPKRPLGGGGESYMVNEYDLCPRCGGTGHRLLGLLICPVCNGSGRVVKRTQAGSRVYPRS